MRKRRKRTKKPVQPSQAVLCTALDSLVCYRCRFCDFECASANMLGRHLGRAHQLNALKGLGRCHRGEPKLLECQTCREAGKKKFLFSRSDALARHMQSAHSTHAAEGEQLLCRLCNIEFDNRAEQEYHCERNAVHLYNNSLVRKRNFERCVSMRRSKRNYP